MPSVWHDRTDRLVVTFRHVDPPEWMDSDPVDELVIEQHGVDLSTLVLNVQSICGHQGGLARAFADAARQIEAHDRPARTTLRGPRGMAVAP